MPFEDKRTHKSKKNQNTLKEPPNTPSVPLPNYLPLAFPFSLQSHSTPIVIPPLKKRNQISPPAWLVVYTV